VRKFKLKQIAATKWEILGCSPLIVVRTRWGLRWRAEVINPQTGMVHGTAFDDFPRKAIQDAVKILDKILCLPTESLTTDKTQLIKEIG
jgi:hypothetical protein